MRKRDLFPRLNLYLITAWSSLPRVLVTQDGCGGKSPRRCVSGSRTHTGAGIHTTSRPICMNIPIAKSCSRTRAERHRYAQLKCVFLVPLAGRRPRVSFPIGALMSDVEQAVYAITRVRKDLRAEMNHSRFPLSFFFFFLHPQHLIGIVSPRSL